MDTLHYIFLGLAYFAAVGFLVFGLDDLFVDPPARGSGAAAALIDALAAEGRVRGWTVIRWITAEDNYRARALYDRLAEKTRWATYDLKL